MKTSAEFSDDRLYRFRLDRVWDEAQYPKRRLVVIGLNPSTADENVDDPTIRRCIGFAKRENCGGLIMLNLFAFRATDPREMKAAVDPVCPCLPELSGRGLGGYNDISIMAALHPSESGRGPIVAAWGCHGTHLGRDKSLRKFLHDYSVTLHVFGLTKDGHPRHPLYLRGDAPLVEWPYAEA